MTKSLGLLASVVVVIAVAAPSTVEAQASRRGGGTSGPPAGGGSRVAAPRNPSPQPAPAPSSEGGRPAARRSSVGAGTTRSAAAPVAAAGDGRIAQTARVGTPGTASARARTSVATRGVAQARPIQPGYPVQPIYPGYPSYGYGYPYYGYGYPYYGYGYGYPYYGYGWSVSFGYGYPAYGPWYYGWHDPFLFGPSVHIHAPYYSSGGEGNEAAERTENRPQMVATGSLRLRVNPSHARVFVNGALAGVASAFGGLTDHLVLPAGTHDLELRADGYVTTSVQVYVRADRTQTERINLPRQ